MFFFPWLVWFRRSLQRYVPSTHYLVQIVRTPSYKHDLESLIALRNFAAHEDKSSKRRAIDVVGTNMSAAGSWVKRQARFRVLAITLRRLASDVATQAPY